MMVADRTGQTGNEAVAYGKRLRVGLHFTQPNLLGSPSKWHSGSVHFMGYETIDFGPVRYAHIIEGLYLVRANERRDDIYFEWNYPKSKRVK